MKNKAIKPEISILHGDDPVTGVHIFRAENGVFEGTSNDKDIRELLPVLEAVLADLTAYRDEIKGLVEVLNSAEKVKPEPEPFN